MERLSLDLIHTFMTFVESPNIVAAAKRLGLSQPAVSVQLKKLEASVPFPLFSFEGKKKVLSHYGRSLYDALKSPLQTIDQSIERVNSLYQDPESIWLRVGARRELLPRIARFIKFVGRVQFVNCTNDEAVSRILAHEIDVAITYTRPDQNHILAKEFFSDGVSFVLPASVLKGRRPTLEMLKSEDFLSQFSCLVYKRDNPPFFREWCKYAGFKLNQLPVKYVCEDWPSILSLVEDGVGYSIVPTNTIPAGDHSFVTFPVPEAIIPQLTFYILYRSDLRDIPAMKQFLEG